MKIDMMEQQPKDMRIPLVGENGSDLGFLVVGVDGYLTPDNEAVLSDAIKHNGTFDQIEDEDGKEKFQLMF